MATIFTNFSGHFRTGGETRFAECLRRKLSDDCVCWYETPIGNTGALPDFLLLGPEYGLIVFEVKDWLPRAILKATKHAFRIKTPEGEKTEKNPFVQAQDYAHILVDRLKQDRTLLSSNGKLSFRWGIGVVLTNITRKTFNESNLGDVLPADCVICKDEMTDGIPPAIFDGRLRKLFPFPSLHRLPEERMTRIRGILYPELCLASHQGELFDAAEQPLADVVKIMDLQQEHLARSLGSGHRIIHGVAGSGKTMILLFRAQFLAMSSEKPVLILCFNKPLANFLREAVSIKNLSEKVIVRHFHNWCGEQLRQHGIPIPENLDGRKEKFRLLVDGVIEAVEARQIPDQQYGAILIDEAHDFSPEWLHIAVRMVDMKSNSLLILYDDAQSIYAHAKRRDFSFKSVGIQARGRTTILRKNYRNTAEILAFAAEFASELLEPEDADEDGVPILRPESAGRHGAWPEIIRKASRYEEATHIARALETANRAGIKWSDMAVIYRATPTDVEVAKVLEKWRIPLGSKNDPNKSENSVKLFTMHGCKGLESMLVAIPAVDQLPLRDCPASEEARLLYVAMTRATANLILTHSKDCDFTDRLRQARGNAAV